MLVFHVTNTLEEAQDKARLLRELGYKTQIGQRRVNLRKGDPGYRVMVEMRHKVFFPKAKPKVEPTEKDLEDICPPTNQPKT